MKNPITLSCALAFIACLTIGWASPPACVAPQVLNRATFEPFHVKTDHGSAVDFNAKSKEPMDIVVRQHPYAAGCGAVRSNTGWHTHPAPVLITVKEGTLWFYEAVDPTCTPKVVSAGQGDVDEGHGHIAVNPSDGRSRRAYPGDPGRAAGEPSRRVGRGPMRLLATQESKDEAQRPRTPRPHRSGG